MGSQSDAQFNVLDSLLLKNFPKANLIKEVDHNMEPNSMNVMMDGLKMFDSKKDGPLTEEKTPALM